MKLIHETDLIHVQTFSNDYQYFRSKLNLDITITNLNSNSYKYVFGITDLFSSINDPMIMMIMGSTERVKDIYLGRREP